MVIERTYPKLSQIVLAKFELGRVKQINPASDHGITVEKVLNSLNSSKSVHGLSPRVLKECSDVQLQTMSLVQSLWARAARSVSDTIM